MSPRRPETTAGSHGSLRHGSWKHSSGKHESGKRIFWKRASWRKTTGGLVLAAALVQMTGCANPVTNMIPGVGGGGNKEQVEKPAKLLKVKTISLNMLPGTNENWPVAVELVRVRDMALVDTLLRISTEEWFGEMGESFRQAHPEALYDAWEVVPGTQVGPFRVRERGKFAGVLFCRTRQETPPLRFLKNGEVTINIDNSGCTPSGGKPGRGRLLPW